jgi:hypothetical protein
MQFRIHAIKVYHHMTDNNSTAVKCSLITHISASNPTSGLPFDINLIFNHLRCIFAATPLPLFPHEKYGGMLSDGLGSCYVSMQTSGQQMDYLS